MKWRSKLSCTHRESGKVRAGWNAVSQMDHRGRSQKQIFLPSTLRRRAYVSCRRYVSISQSARDISVNQGGTAVSRYRPWYRYMQVVCIRDFFVGFITENFRQTRKRRRCHTFWELRQELTTRKLWQWNIKNIRFTGCSFTRNPYLHQKGKR